HLDRLPVDLPEGTGRRGGRIVDPGAMTAILCVGPHAGFGRHMVAALHRLFPELFTNLVFVPAAARGGRWMTPFEDDSEPAGSVERDLAAYVDWARDHDMRAELRSTAPGETSPSIEAICRQLLREFPRAVVFSGEPVFPDGDYSRSF